ncbi:MAG: adenylosuccinate synthase [Limisphaerales bacterium]|jgi:adenylosuccinate synthase
MANTILIGAQWGDEGKGKIIDVLTESTDVVVRSQGGANAGHTVIVGDQQYILHLIPSGILRPEKKCVIGNGVVIDPISLLAEIDELKAMKIKVGKNLIISETAHVVLPYHKEIDGLRERKKGRNKIGTTKRGIGPAYGDKIARVGLRMIDLTDPDRLAEKLKPRIRDNNVIIKAGGGKPLSFREVFEDYAAAGQRLKPYITNTVLYLHDALNRKQDLLFEGAQGTFLDIDHGTYPFVTSSNTTAGGACTGSGVPPHRMDLVMGVMKAYTTRVGEGPFISEDDTVSDLLHGMGREFGATTGRARRCGWFDSVVTRYATMVNGIDELAVTNLDGLDSCAKIKVCVGYKAGRKRYDHMPTDLDTLQNCKPIFEEFDGWQSCTEEIRSWKKLPIAARKYLTAISDLTGAKLKIISVGPKRDQTFFMK